MKKDHCPYCRQAFLDDKVDEEKVCGPNAAGETDDQNPTSQDPTGGESRISSPSDSMVLQEGEEMA